MTSKQQGALAGRARALTLLVAAVLLFHLPVLAADPPLTGFYGGGYGKPVDSFVHTRFELVQNGESLGGQVIRPYESADVPKIEKLQRQGQRITFEAAGLKFDLTRTATGYEGTVQTLAGVIEPAVFTIRPGGAPAPLLAAYEGTYDLGEGRLLTLSRMSAVSELCYLELPSGRTGFLYNVSDTEFIAGPCIFCAGPEVLRVRFAPNPVGGHADRITVRLDGKEQVVSRLTSYREEPVTFRSADGTKLAGSLFIPAGDKKHPALVLVHGSGTQSRNGFFGYIRFVAEAYARRGIAVLSYDKRGVGDSEGDWEKARGSLATLADDAAAAMRYLETRKEIRADRIGLSGSSQAAWIMPMAATRYPKAYLIQHRSGSAPIGVEESNRSGLVRQMQAGGFSQSDIDKAVRIRVMMDEYAKTGQNWEELAAAAEKAKDEFWMTAPGLIGGLPPRDRIYWAWLREAFSVDVSADYANFAGPIQVLYGGVDALIEPQAAIARMRAALKNGKSKDVEIEVVPNATHNYLEGKNGGEQESDGLTRFVPGFYEKVVEWAVKRMR
jgi:uncharacterized protein